MSHTSQDVTRLREEAVEDDLRREMRTYVLDCLNADDERDDGPDLWEQEERIITVALSHWAECGGDFADAADVAFNLIRDEVPA